jgi:hypothetical protein
MKAQCKLCGDIIESKYRHDFVSCKCGEIFADGGSDYSRYGATDLNNFLRIEELTMTPDELMDAKAQLSYGVRQLLIWLLMQYGIETTQLNKDDEAFDNCEHDLIALIINAVAERVEGLNKLGATTEHPSYMANGEYIFRGAVLRAIRAMLPKEEER